MLVAASGVMRGLMLGATGLGRLYLFGLCVGGRYCQGACIASMRSVDGRAYCVVHSPRLHVHVTAL